MWYKNTILLIFIFIVLLNIKNKKMTINRVLIIVFNIV